MLISVLLFISLTYKNLIIIYCLYFFCEYKDDLKKKVRFSIITPTESDNLPAELKNATRICLKQDFRKNAQNKRIYMKLTDAYPDYLLVS